MFSNIPALSSACESLLTGVLIALAIMLIVVLIRLMIGPTAPDRLLAVNMLGTLSLVAIVVLELLLGESYLLDIAIIYAVLSFLAVIVLSKIYTRAYQEYHLELDELDGNTPAEVTTAEAVPAEEGGRE